MITTVALATLVISVIGLGITLGRKLPLLARMDMSAGKSEQEKRKQSILEERLRRKVSTATAAVRVRLGPAGGWAKRQWQHTQKKLVDLEHEYKVRSLPVLLNRRQRHKLDQEIAEILTEARALYDDNEPQAAEEKCLQAIRLEPRSVPAFELLGELYFTTNEYGHAREVYQYLLKLLSESDPVLSHGQTDETPTSEAQSSDILNRQATTYYVQLSQVYRALGEGMKAFASAHEASRLEPNNPRVLDEVIEASLMAGKKQFAADAIDQLAEVNPNNSKIPDWREKLSAIESGPAVPGEAQIDPPTLYETHTSPNERS